MLVFFSNFGTHSERDIDVHSRNVLAFIRAGINVHFERIFKKKDLMLINAHESNM